MTDRLLVRYAALAQRLEALHEEPLMSSQAAAPVPGQADAPDHADAPGPLPADTGDEALELITDTVYRLGLYASAMPGARMPPPESAFAALDQGLEQALDQTLGQTLDDSD